MHVFCEFCVLLLVYMCCLLLFVACCFVLFVLWLCAVVVFDVCFRCCCLVCRLCLLLSFGVVVRGCFVVGLGVGDCVPVVVCLLSLLLYVDVCCCGMCSMPPLRVVVG